VVVQRKRSSALDDLPVSYLRRRTGEKLACDCCGKRISGEAYIRVEGKTGETLFYCSPHCLETDWK
jgi:hypothetical protein